MRLAKSNIIKTIIILIILLSNTMLGAEGIKIIIPGEVEVRENWITLGEIATITGVTGEKLDDLRAVRLGKAVLPGYTREVYQEQIKVLLKNEGFSPEDIIIDSPNRIRVRTRSIELSVEDLLDEAKSYLNGILEYPSEKTIIRLRHSPPDLVLPDRDYEIEFKLSNANNLIGNTSLQALILIDGIVYRTIFLSFEILVKEQVYVARRPISIGEKIKGEDFYLDYRPLSNYYGELINNLDIPLVTHGVVKTRIPKEGILTSYHLRMPDIIKNGDLVQAEVIIGNIKVTTIVRARQSGKFGDYINVENRESGHRFKAQIINSNLVRVIN